MGLVLKSLTRELFSGSNEERKDFGINIRYLKQKEHPDITREAYPYNVDFRVLEINAVGNKK